MLRHRQTAQEYCEEGCKKGYSEQNSTYPDANAHVADAISRNTSTLYSGIIP